MSDGRRGGPGAAVVAIVFACTVAVLSVGALALQRRELAAAGGGSA